MRLGGFLVRPQRPEAIEGGRSTSGGERGERGTLALEFLIILPFLVALTWLVQWAGESGRAALLTSLTAEEAANVAVMAKQRGFSSQDALKAADEYVESRSQLWGRHCINASYDETTEKYDMSEAVGAAWWEGEDGDSAVLNRGGTITELSSKLADEVWLEYKIGDSQVKLAIAVVRVRCQSRFRFSPPIAFSARTHEAVAWEPMITHIPITVR